MLCSSRKSNDGYGLCLFRVPVGDGAGFFQCTHRNHFGFGDLLHDVADGTDERIVDDANDPCSRWERVERVAEMGHGAWRDTFQFSTIDDEINLVVNAVDHFVDLLHTGKEFFPCLVSSIGEEDDRLFRIIPLGCDAHMRTPLN